MLRISTEKELQEEVKRIRNKQLEINEMIRRGEFKVPIHLALGHETIAVAVREAIREEDALVCSHRNIHYALAMGIDVIDSYLNKDFGSMNCSDPLKQLFYSSSILGNNFGLAVGLAYARNGVTFVASGDGAMEEGGFYEALIFSRELHVPTVFIIENNDWSMSTKINDRRYPINLETLAKSIGATFLFLDGNDVAVYADTVETARRESWYAPVVLEVMTQTLGSRMDGERFINYHSGLANEIK